MNNQNTEPNIYVGNGIERVRKTGDKYIVASVCIDDVENIPEQYITKSKGGKRYVKLLINPYKDGPNQYGNTHSIKVDTYKKDENKENEPF